LKPALHFIIAKIKQCRDLYIHDGFSWESATTSDAAALVFRNACADIVKYRTSVQLPLTTNHIRNELNIDSTATMTEYVSQRVIQTKAAASDQCIVQLPGHKTKKGFKRDLAYVSPIEIWMQVSNRTTPMHVDHGRVLAYILPCTRLHSTSLCSVLCNDSQDLGFSIVNIRKGITKYLTNEKV
jgi:hypothetical protein